MSVSSLQLNLAILREHFFERYAEFISQGVDHQICYSAPVFREAIGEEAVENVSVRQAPLWRPSSAFNMLYEDILHFFGKPAIAPARLVNDHFHQAMCVKKVSDCLFKLTLQPVCFEAAPMEWARTALMVVSYG